MYKYNVCIICVYVNGLNKLTACIYRMCVCVFVNRNYRKRSHESIRKLSKSMGGFWEKGDGAK